MTVVESAPIACTLSADDYQARTALIRSLARDALRRCERKDLTLLLYYSGNSRSAVVEMVENERTCCAFLTFNVQDVGDEVIVTIKAPEAARETADLLFAEFIGGKSEQVACGCSTAKSDPSPGLSGKKVATTAAVTAAGALACAACCVLPFALPAALLASAGGIFALIKAVHPILTVLSLLTVVGARAWVAWQSVRAQKKPASATIIVMLVATVFVGIAVNWRTIEKPIIQYLKS